MEISKETRLLIYEDILHTLIITTKDKVNLYSLIRSIFTSFGYIQFIFDKYSGTLHPELNLFIEEYSKDETDIPHSINIILFCIEILKSE